MKKLLAVFALASFALSMVACNHPSNQEETSSAPIESSETTSSGEETTSAAPSFVQDELSNSSGLVIFLFKSFFGSFWFLTDLIKPFIVSYLVPSPKTLVR